MENPGKWKLVKIGFLLGIGFIIPQMIALYSGTLVAMFVLPKVMEASFDESGAEAIESYMSSYDKTSQIRIDEYRETINGNQLLILGSISNTGKARVSSVELEAELKDAEGKMVYECSEYITRDLKEGDTENFQIKCGCGKTPVPEYRTIDVRVVRASTY
jgi:hypothetical protein